ncbi:MAG: SRPBCC family protein [Blastocatellia bacterium]|nr:SRPBCC family protein [Blastocatellia bacterium]
MAGNNYHFTTHWRVTGTIQEVSDILSDVESLSVWWPSVYLEVNVLEPGDPNGVGKLVSLYTKGWLPYTLRWSFRVTTSQAPHGFSLEAIGDFVGQGVWTLVQNGSIAEITYDWSIRAEKPILRLLSFLLKPIFSANHKWAMARGEESLKLELLRRRANSHQELARIPAPPGPTFPHNLRK